MLNYFNNVQNDATNIHSLNRLKYFTHQELPFRGRLWGWMTGPENPIVWGKGTVRRALERRM